MEDARPLVTPSLLAPTLPNDWKARQTTITLINKDTFEEDPLLGTERPTTILIKPSDGMTQKTSSALDRNLISDVWTTKSSIPS
jgi:hypothetical protein